MKAKNYDGTIKVYDKVPKTYNNIIGFNYLSGEQLKTHGFYDVVTPTYNADTQDLGDIYFSSDNEIFTYAVVNKTWTKSLSDLKEQKIKDAKTIANQELLQTDWIIVRDTELGNATAQDILDKRAAIRTACANHEAAINAKTSKSDVVSYNIIY